MIKKINVGVIGLGVGNKHLVSLKKTNLLIKLRFMILIRKNSIILLKNIKLNQVNLKMK